MITAENNEFWKSDQNLTQHYLFLYIHIHFSSSSNLLLKS